MPFLAATAAPNRARARSSELSGSCAGRIRPHDPRALPLDAALGRQIPAPQLSQLPTLIEKISPQIGALDLIADLVVKRAFRPSEAGVYRCQLLRGARSGITAH
jgi:hypothetical protein